MDSPRWCNRNKQRKIKNKEKSRSNTNYVKQCNAQSKIQTILRPSAHSLRSTTSFKERIRQYSKPNEQTQKD